MLIIIAVVVAVTVGVTVAVVAVGQILDVTNNDLNDIPSELGLVRTLNKLVITGNMLRRMKRSVAEDTVENMKKYLKSRLRPGKSS